jgi:hypothetical protein
MKLRTGFVSNSSSSSFVLLKSHLTEEQVNRFSEWADCEHNGIAREGYVYESKSAFHGELDYHIDRESVADCLTHAEIGD